MRRDSTRSLRDRGTERLAHGQRMTGWFFSSRGLSTQDTALGITLLVIRL
jgi:hypothetical protein